MRVSLFWLGNQPLVRGKMYLFKLGTARVKVQLEEIIHVINAADMSNVQQKEQIELHDVAECVFLTQRALAFDLADTLAGTSRFVIVDENEISGGGIILSALPDSQREAREEKQLRNQKWISSDITAQERAQRYHQEPKLVVITGKRKSGRKTLARELEKELFAQGKFVYYLGMGSVVYGINQDIEHNGSGKHQREHIRRLAEVVHILMDTGLIVLVTALELSRDDLQMIEMIVEPNIVKVVWIGDETTTDAPIDLHLGESTRMTDRLDAVQRLLSENGNAP
jgi:bifunctional enzyme CysN/CysC